MGKDEIVMREDVVFDYLDNITKLLIGCGRTDKAKKYLSKLEKELLLLEMLKNHPNYSLGDLENVVDSYDEGMRDDNFDLYEIRFLYRYFGRNWGEPPYYPELDDEEY